MLYLFQAKYKNFEKEKFSEEYLILRGKHFVDWLIEVYLSFSSINFEFQFAQRKLKKKVNERLLQYR
tara:strand:- start:14212 stop:14412 length:201 start_codon:yes stop_codon:yes gene_type:complete